MHNPNGGEDRVKIEVRIYLLFIISTNWLNMVLAVHVVISTSKSTK